MFTSVRLPTNECLCHIVYLMMRRLYRLENKEIIPAVVGVSGEVHSCTGTEALYRPYGP